MPSRFQLFDGSQNGAARENKVVGCTNFSTGDRVRITSGKFAGLVGVVKDPALAVGAAGTVILSGGDGELLPITVSASIDGHTLLLRVPPELLERCDPGREAEG
jgi:hypothetical protein